VQKYDKFPEHVRKAANLSPISIGEYDYPLPDERIAKYPLQQRDASKLLIYKEGVIRESIFRNAAEFLPPDSLLVYNNTRVIRARMVFRKATGARIEIFCLEPAEPADYALSLGATGKCSWNCMIGNLKKWKEGSLWREVMFEGRQVQLRATRMEQGDDTGAHKQGENRNVSAHRILFEWDDDSLCFADLLEKSGELPIPPYLNRDTEESDHDTYQTVYSKIKGSVAAPTAGLHFTDEVLNDLRSRNISTEELTLHVGAGTFQPVKTDDVADHEMHSEVISVRRSTLANLIQHQGNIIAVGTTSVRTLESLYYLGVQLHEKESKATQQDETSQETILRVAQWDPYLTHSTLSTDQALHAILSYLDRNHLSGLQAQTQLMIRPGFKFRIIRGMFTNFHQPKSTLLLLVSAFTGAHWKTIYEYALANDFRFLSYGDSSLLLT
jgi:S-adenosylmethionine:tRNA ribosyltransferase-isomerase